MSIAARLSLQSLPTWQMRIEAALCAALLLLPGTLSAQGNFHLNPVIAKLEAGEAGALPAFAALVGLRPDDGVAAFHLKRLLNGSNGTRIEVR